VKNWTPQALRCGFGSCPSVHEIDGDKLLIVGPARMKLVNGDSLGAISAVDLPWERLSDSMSGGEAVVAINRSLLADLIRDEVEKAVQAERERWSACVKDLHDTEVDYSVINHLSAHNNHGLKWARRLLGFKEEWTHDEAKAYISDGPLPFVSGPTPSQEDKT